MADVSGSVKGKQVEEEIIGLEKCIEELISAVNVLEDRLQNVLTPISPTCDNEKSPSALVGLAQAIKNNEIKIVALTSRLRGILERCQL